MGLLNLFSSFFLSLSHTSTTSPFLRLFDLFIHSILATSLRRSETFRNQLHHPRSQACQMPPKKTTDRVTKPKVTPKKGRTSNPASPCKEDAKAHQNLLFLWSCLQSTQAKVSTLLSPMSQFEFIRHKPPSFDFSQATREHNARVYNMLI